MYGRNSSVEATRIKSAFIKRTKKMNMKNVKSLHGAGFCEFIKLLTEREF